MSRGFRSGLSLLLVAGLVVVAGLEARAQTPKKGGVLKVAVLGDPPTLDSHWTTANFVEVITQHIYESLYTLDQNYQPIPVLAEALPAVSADGLTYTIKLRQGIRFHNGKEMTSEDVVASLKRWGGTPRRPRPCGPRWMGCGPSTGPRWRSSSRRSRASS
jgi:peptide/nickel transport system substrate-binding protein